MVFAIFVIIASLTVAGPALFYVVGGGKAAKTLESMKTWLAMNNATVMAVLCLVLGVVVFGKGISGLFA